MTDDDKFGHNQLIKKMKDAVLWGDIHRLAKKDLKLQELLDRAVIYYRLKYEQRRR